MICIVGFLLNFKVLTGLTMRISYILFFLSFMMQQFCNAQNPLYIPPAMNGTVFNLFVQSGTTQFFPPVNTPTFGVNGALLAPTLIMNKGDLVTINITNNLPGTTKTTMHWHGFHVPARYDGGPHQVINNGAIWSPSFQIMNDAGTYWYHPHGNNQTDLQVSKGLAGMIIIKDTVEAALILPRTYGIDDFPLIVQTKSFDILKQIAISTAYDTVPMVNGTINPYLDAPGQVIRLRLLNGASDRSFMFGFSNNMNFHLIATDGGLIDSTLTLNRLRLSNGERAEILVDLSAYVNDTIFLMSYGSELSKGIIGADSVGDASDQITDYYNNPLNGADYKLLQINIIAAGTSPVTTIPAYLNTFSSLTIDSATVYRTMELDTLSAGAIIGNPAEGPFGINRKSFDMDSINETVYLNTTEIWTVKNFTKVAHPFHIHDVQFNLLDINGAAVPEYEKGKKDVVLVMPGDSVRFITKFEDFADSIPYMYHCHLLHHEDDGMMGSFVVVDPESSIAENSMNADLISVYPNPAADEITIVLSAGTGEGIKQFRVTNILGEEIYASELWDRIFSVKMNEWKKGIYLFSIRSGNKFFIKKVIRL
jgi:blue copper oxidase